MPESFPPLVAAELARLRADAPPLTTATEAWAHISEAVDSVKATLRLFKGAEAGRPVLLRDLVAVAATAQMASEDVTSFDGDFPTKVSRMIGYRREHRGTLIKSSHDAYGKMCHLLRLLLADHDDKVMVYPLLFGLATVCRAAVEDLGLISADEDADA